MARRRRRKTRKTRAEPAKPATAPEAEGAAAADGHTLKPWLLLLAVVLPYLPWLGNGFVYDDQVLIVNRAPPESLSAAFSVFGEIHHPSGLQYYRPLAALTLRLQQWVGGNEPWQFHAFNLLLLVVMTAVVRGLLQSLLPSSKSLWVASLAALTFALHPSVSSTVHAISGRETLLAVTFMAGGLWAFLRGGRRHLALAGLLLGCGLLCKEQVIALPLLYVLADALRLSPTSPRRENGPKGARAWLWLQRHVPFVLMVGVYFFVRNSVFGEGAASKPLTFALFDEPGRPLLSLWYTLQSSVTPTFDLSYEPRLEAWWSLPRTLLTAGALVLVGWGAGRFPRERRLTLLFWLGWIVLTLLPSANIVAQETLYAERYVVLPWLGIVGLLATLGSRLDLSPARPNTWAVVAGTLLIVLGVFSYHRGQFFADDERFLSQWAKSDPSSYQARASLAELLKQQGRDEEALEHERESLRLIHLALPEPWCIKRHFALGALLEKTGRYAEAAGQYEEILRLKPHFTGARRKLERARRRVAQKQPSELPMQLSSERRSALVAALAPLKGQPVWFAATTTDAASQRLQQQLQEVFGSAGWRLKGTQQVDFRVKPGLFLFVADAEAPAYVQQLEAALKAAGLPVTAFATDYRAYSREMRANKPAWKGFSLAADQDFVLVVGRTP